MGSGNNLFDLVTSSSENGAGALSRFFKILSLPRQLPGG